MKVFELLELLADVDGDAEVRLATQPFYPLQTTVGGVASSLELDDDDDELEAAGPEAGEVVWLLEGSVPEDGPYDGPYATSQLWEIAEPV